MIVEIMSPFWQSPVSDISEDELTTITSIPSEVSVTITPCLITQ